MSEMKGEMPASLEWTLTDFLKRLNVLGFEEEPRPSEFKHHDVSLGGKNFSIESTGWDVAAGRACARFAEITGPAMNISTVMLYPTGSPEILPVFAAEWVVFGQNIHTLVLDVETCSKADALSEQMRKSFSPIHERWSQVFPLNRDKPAWFESIETPWALFGQANVDQMSSLRRAFQDYLDVTLANFYQPGIEQAVAGEDHPDVTNYKHHHYVNSPGHRLLGVKFGQEHTDQLLKNWHFGPARPALVDEGSKSSSVDGHHNQGSSLWI